MCRKSRVFLFSLSMVMCSTITCFGLAFSKSERQNSTVVLTGINQMVEGRVPDDCQRRGISCVAF